MKKAKLATADLDASAMVLLKDGHCLKDQTLALCEAPRKGRTQQDYQATSLETLVHRVASGLGYTAVAVLSRPQAGKLGPAIGRTLVLARALKTHVSRGNRYATESYHRDWGARNSSGAFVARGCR